MFYTNFIRPNSFRVLLLFVLLSSIGIALIPSLSFQLEPNYKLPGLIVKVNWSGVAPKAIEQEVVGPLEAIFAAIDGVVQIKSKSSVGEGIIEIEMSRKLNLELFRFEVASRIRQLYKTFPPEVSYPQIYLQNPDNKISDSPVLIYALSGQQSPVVLSKIAHDLLSPQLALVPGLDKVIVSGDQKEEWKVSFNVEEIGKLGIRRKDILKSLRSIGKREVIGTIQEGAQLLSLRLKQKNTQSDLLKIPIKKIDQKMVLLGSIAKVELVNQEPRSHYRINGKNSIRLRIYADDLQNQLAFSKAIKKQVDTLSKQIPPTCQLSLDHDATTHLAIELEKVKNRAGLSLLILFLLLLLMYRNGYLVLVLCSSLLVNIGVAAIFYAVLEVHLHLYALAAIAVSFSLIIDNTLVITHHLLRYQTVNIFPALLASTLTTIAAICIIFFLPEKWKATLDEFAIVMVVNLLVSLLVAFLFVPALITQLNIKSIRSFAFPYQGKRQQVFAYRWYIRLLQALLKKRILFVISVILLFGTPFFLIPGNIPNWTTYNQLMGNHFFVEKVRPVLDKLLGGSLRPFVLYVYDKASFRDIGETQLNIRARLPSGTTLAQMNTAMREMEHLLYTHSLQIKRYITDIQSGEFGQISIFFNEGYDRVFPHLLKSRIITEAANQGGIEWTIRGVGEAFQNASLNAPPRFRVAMYGYNDELLTKYTHQFADQLKKHARVQGVDTDANLEWWLKDLFVFQLDLDSRKLAIQGLSNELILDLLNFYDQNKWPDFYFENRNLRLTPEDLTDRDKWAMKNKYLSVGDQKMALDNLFSLEKVERSNAIFKEDQQYLRMVEFEYTGAERFGQEYLDKCIREVEKNLPLGFKLEQTDMYQFGSMEDYHYEFLLIIILAIFFIVSILFESLVQGLIVVLLIPTSYIGIFLTFYAFDLSFDQGAYAAFILLSGLVVNGMIILLNAFNKYQKSNPHLPATKNYLKAFHSKIIPVLLTIISTSAGLIPFMLDGSETAFWFALAAGTIGGLIFSIVTITLFIPIWIIRI